MSQNSAVVLIPGQKLDVAGNIRASGTIASGGSITIDGTPGSERITSTDDLEIHVAASRVLRLETNATAPNIAAFEGANITTNLLGSVADVGDGAPGKYEGNQDLDDMALNASRNLWFQLKLPPTSSVLVAQEITVTVTAEAP